MSKRNNTILLTAEERKELKRIVSKGTCAARTIKRANVLLNLNQRSGTNFNLTDLSHLLQVSLPTINRIIKSYQDIGIACIYRKKRIAPPVERKITGELEAHLIAMACHNPPRRLLQVDIKTIIRKNGANEIHRQYKSYNGWACSQEESP